MPIRRRLLPLLALMAPLSALVGCQDAAEPSIAVAIIGKPADLSPLGIRLSPAGQMVRAASADGLVAFDAEGRVIPALADRWIVADDGLSYIFRLRDGTWSDGTPLTGESGRDALQQALDRLHGSALGIDLSAIADVRAMAGRVVEIRLHYPMPDLLDLLAQPELALLRKDRGTGTLQAKHDGPTLLLRPVPPDRLGLPQPEDWAKGKQSIRLKALPAQQAIQQYKDGTVDAVFGGTISDYALALPASGLSRGDLRVDPVAGLFGLLITSTTGPLGNPETREALAMAIDRDALAADLGIREWLPSSRIIPASATDSPAAIGERWAGIDMAHRRAEAAARLARGKLRRSRLTILTIALPKGPGADIIYARIQSDLAAIGISVQRVDNLASADLRLIDSVARYGRADWYLNQFACAAGHSLCSPQTDAKVALARAEPQEAKRAAALEDAEAALTLSNLYIPLGSPIRWALVRGKLSGFSVNVRGTHALTPVSIGLK
ncbi:MAG: hypothetical protein RLZZ136_1548 [Pseudomonadota bacterium]|jgi:ABC-type transport system substrate-binding protein